MKNQKASSFITMPIYTTDGEYQGYIINNIFDEDFNNLIGFKVVNDENETESFLPYHNITKMGDDCIFASTLTQDFNFDTHNNPIGKPIYNSNGNFLGQILDIDLSSRRIVGVELSGKTIPARFIHFIGKNCVILNKKLQKNEFSQIRASLTGNEPKVEIQSTPPASFAKIGRQEFPMMHSITSPKKVILNPPTLIGKVADQDIFGLNNELIVKKGQVINQQKIDMAKRHGKLNLLIINSK